MTQPGCYGLPSAYYVRSAACSSCSARAKCAESVRQVLDGVKGLVDVSAFMEGVRVQYASVSNEPVPTTLMAAPVKVRKRLERMIESGARARAQDELARGINPFPADKDKALAFAGRALLGVGFTREQLRAHLVDLGWSGSAAASQVSATVALLRGLLLTEEQGRVVRMSRQIQQLPMTP